MVYEAGLLSRGVQTPRTDTEAGLPSSGVQTLSTDTEAGLLSSGVQTPSTDTEAGLPSSGVQTPSTDTEAGLPSRGVQTPRTDTEAGLLSRGVQTPRTDTEAGLPSSGVQTLAQEAGLLSRGVQTPSTDTEAGLLSRGVQTQTENRHGGRPAEQRGADAHSDLVSGRVLLRDGQLPHRLDDSHGLAVAGWGGAALVAVHGQLFVLLLLAVAVLGAAGAQRVPALVLRPLVQLEQLRQHVVRRGDDLESDSPSHQNHPPIWRSEPR